MNRYSREYFLFCLVVTVIVVAIVLLSDFVKSLMN